MRKLLERVFAIWKTQRPFDPHHHSWRTDDAPPPAATQEATGRTEDKPLKSAVTAASTVSLPPQGSPVNATAPHATWGPIDFAPLRRHVSMRDVLERLDHLARLSGSGPQRRGPCPVHAPGSRRCRPFSVHLQRNVFRCFDARCGAQGNVLDLWAAVHGQPLVDAAHHLADAFGLSYATEKRNPYSRSPEAQPVGGQNP